MAILLALLGCSQEYGIANPPREGGFVNQLDGTPEDTGTGGIIGSDPLSPDVTTQGVRFPIAFMQGTSPALNGPAAFELWIESESTTQAEIVSPQSDLALQVSLQPGMNVVPLPDPQLEPVSSGFVFGVGLELLTEAPVYAVAVHHRVGYSEASSLLPWPELGVNYVVTAVADTEELTPSAFVVLATEDETRVTITPSTSTTDFRPPLVAYPVELQAGEVVQIQADGDLSGTKVTATKKVAVFAGGQEPVVDCDGPNHVWEQLPPLSRWATDWLVTPWPEQRYQYVNVLAADAATTVSLNCDNAVTLGPNQSTRFRIQDAGRIRSNKPVLVTQLATGGTCERNDDEAAIGDPNLLLAARTALTREGPLALRPAEHPTLLEVVGSEDRTDRVVLWRDDDGSIDLQPPSARINAWSVDDLVVEAAQLDGAATASGPPLRGFVYGATEGNAYAYDIGVACSDCGPALREPALCD
ncbi:MAG: IgGFc-binding protein [Myxococcota bacterium]